MSYIESNLIGNEKVMFRVQASPIVFSKTVVLFAACILWIWLIGVTNISALVVGVVGVVMVATHVLTWMCSEFAVTDRRVIAKYGIVACRTVEIDLKRVEGMRLIQDASGSICDYGTLVIDGVGGTQEVLPNISSPRRFREVLQEAIEDATRRESMAKWAYKRS